MVFIYHLLDENDNVRYVGQTVDPRARFEAHLYGSGSGRHKRRWIQSMLRSGLRPTMVVYQEVPDSEADEAERREIDRQLSLGARLTNSKLGPLEVAGIIERERRGRRIRKSLRRRKNEQTPSRRGRVKTCKPKDPEWVKQLRQLRRKLMQKLDAYGRTDRTRYITMSFVRRNRVEIESWLAADHEAIAADSDRRRMNEFLVTRS